MLGGLGADPHVVEFGKCVKELPPIEGQAALSNVLSGDLLGALAELQLQGFSVETDGADFFDKFAMPLLNQLMDGIKKELVGLADVPNPFDFFGALGEVQAAGPVGSLSDMVEKEVLAITKTIHGAAKQLHGITASIVEGMRSQHANDVIGCAIDHMLSPILPKLEPVMEKGTKLGFDTLVGVYRELRMPGKEGSIGESVKLEVGEASTASLLEKHAMGMERSFAGLRSNLLADLRQIVGDIEELERAGSPTTPAADSTTTTTTTTTTTNDSKPTTTSDSNPATQAATTKDSKPNPAVQPAKPSPQLPASAQFAAEAQLLPSPSPSPSPAPKSAGNSGLLMRFLGPVIQSSAQKVIDMALDENGRLTVDRVMRSTVADTCSIVTETLGRNIDLKAPKEGMEMFCGFDVKGKVPKAKDVLKVGVVVLINIVFDELFKHVFTPLIAQAISLVEMVIGDVITLVDSICGAIPVGVAGIICGLAGIVVGLFIELVVPGLVESVAISLYEAARQLTVKQADHWVDAFTSSDGAPERLTLVDDGAEWVSDMKPQLQPIMEEVVIPIFQRALKGALPGVSKAVNDCERQLALVHTLFARKFGCKTEVNKAVLTGPKPSPSPAASPAPALERVAVDPTTTAMAMLDPPLSASRSRGPSTGHIL